MQIIPRKMKQFGSPAQKHKDAPVPESVRLAAEAQRQMWAERLAACQALKNELREQAEVLTPTVFDPVVRKPRRKGRNRRRMQ